MDRRRHPEVFAVMCQWPSPHQLDRVALDTLLTPVLAA
jgi:hypothetical protein